jgi:hypothetical protein
MALGDVSANNSKKAVQIMAPTTANVAAPTLATDGIPVYPVASFNAADTGHGYQGRDARESTLLIEGTCTAGQVLVGTFTLWGYLAASGKWYELPTSTGTAITPVALAETGTDTITLVQRFQNLGHFDRLALQLASIGGGGATFNAWLVTGIAGTAA